MKKMLLAFLGIMCLSVLPAQTSDYVIRSAAFKTPVTAVQVSPDGRLILAGFEDGTLRILNATTLEERLVVEQAGTAAVYDIEMSPKMDVIFLSSGNRILLYDTTGVRINAWSHHRNTMWSMDLDPAGRYMVSTEVNKTFQLINVYEGEVEQSMRGHEDITFAVAFSPDGKYIASGSNDQQVFLWDMASREVIATFHGHSGNIYDVAFSPDGKYVAACSMDKSVRIWDIEKKELHRLLKGHQDMVLEIEFSPDGKYLLSASADQSIKLWDVASGEQLYAFLDNKGSIPDIEFLTGGETFVSVCMDGTLNVHRIHPEIFVMKYFREEMEKEMADDPLFLPREKGEKRSDFEARAAKAEKKKEELVARYYQRYLAR
jgi:WD40 repeat protein